MRARYRPDLHADRVCPDRRGAGTASVVEAARREVREETGIDVEITGLSGIYSDPRHVIAYDPT